MLVLAGEGRGFCSGGDVEEIIGELQKMKAAELLEFTRMTGATVQALRDVPIPVIASINGVAAGAGSVLALASDFRLLATSASFRFLFTHVGLAGADMGSAYLLPRIVGVGRATQMLMLGDKVTAEEALACGLASSVVADDELRDATTALARRLADGPSLAYGDDEVPHPARAGHGPRRVDRAGGDDPGAAHAEPRPRRVLRGLARQAPTRLAGAVAMEHEIVTAPELAPPVGYAHAVLAAPGRVVALGGQTALGPDNTIVGATMTEQFDVAAGNVVAALRAAGGEPSDIVSMQIFVTDVPAYKAALRELGPVWQRHFGRRYPATGLFGVTRLFDDEALIELMALAVLAEDGR